MTATRSIHAWRVWVALIAAPLCLALSFGVAAAVLVVTQGVSGDELGQRLPAIAPWAAPPGFLALFFLTWRLARAEGITWSSLGWIRPRPVDLLIGCLVAIFVGVVDQTLLFPWLQRLQPTFDPVQRQVALPALVLMLGLAVLAEDTLYRGYAFEVLRARRGLLFSVVVTSLAYALLAPGPELPLKLWAVGFGLVLAGLRAWRGSLWPVVIVHAVASLGPRLWTLVH